MLLCAGLCTAMCEWIAICTSAFHIPWEPVVSFQILTLVSLHHKSHSEPDPEIMISVVFAVRNILLRLLGAFE